MAVPRTMLAIRCIVAAFAVQGCAATEPSASQHSDTLTNSALTRDINALFQTDSLSYQLNAGAIGYQADIGLVFTNRSPATAYVANCRGGTDIHLEKLVGDTWVPYWEPVLLACVSPPILVQPFQRWTTTISVFGGYPGCNCGPRFASDEVAGVYRVVFRDVYSSYNASTGAYASQMTFSMRVSNPFAFVPQQR